MEDLTGRVIEHYKILEIIGEGGMARVYKAQDSRLNRLVAFKIVLPTVKQPDVALKRFEREAKTLAQLNHPNIVKILDYGEYDGWPFLVIEYITGGTLKQIMGKPIPWKEMIGYVLPVARALQYAHQHDVIHRDIKPANILLEDQGHLMLSDFGIAKAVQESSETADPTGTGLGVGTPDYMAPEQITDNMANPKTDMYSLGLVMYEMICGRKPFTAGTPAGVMVKQVNARLPRLVEYVKDLPLPVEEMIVRTLSKRPEQRFAHMGDLISALEMLQQGKVKKRPQKRNYKKMVVATVGGFLGIAIIVGILIAVVLGFNLVSNVLDKRQQTQQVIQPALKTEISTEDQNPSTQESLNTSNALFYDDFSDPASGWQRDHKSEGMTDYFNGSYRIFVNAKQTDFWATPQLFVDQDVMVEVLATKNGGPDNNEFGVICRYSAYNNLYDFYFFVISSNGYAAIGKVDRGNQSTLVTSEDVVNAVHQGSASNRIQALCAGDALSLMVNGETLLSTNDGSFSSGDVGLIAGAYAEPGTDILFDEFLVTSP